MAAAGTVVKTIQRAAGGMQVTLAWTANASGSVAEGGTTGKGVFSANGYLVGVEYEAVTADDLYDVTLLDSGSKDVLRGLGANKPSAANTTYDNKYRSDVRDVDGAWLYFFNKNLTLTIANGGNLGTGIIRLKFADALPA